MSSSREGTDSSALSSRPARRGHRSAITKSGTLKAAPTPPIGTMLSTESTISRPGQLAEPCNSKRSPTRTDCSRHAASRKGMPLIILFIDQRFRVAAKPPKHTVGQRSKRQFLKGHHRLECASGPPPKLLLGDGRSAHFAGRPRRFTYSPELLKPNRLSKLVNRLKTDT